jgi:hypothetical protein
MVHTYTPAATAIGLNKTALEQRLSDLQTMLNDMRQQRDQWRAQADHLAEILVTCGRADRVTVGFVAGQRATPWWWQLTGSE